MNQNEFAEDKFKIQLLIGNLVEDVKRMNGKLSRAIERKNIAGTIDEDWARRISAAIHIKERQIRKLRAVLKEVTPAEKP